MNFLESKELEYWLTDNFPDFTIREMYDKWSEPLTPELYAVEGSTDRQLEYFLKLKYGNKIIETRFIDGKNQSK